MEVASQRDARKQKVTAMRLFIALQLPPVAVAELAAWRDSIVADKDGLRPVANESLHVTLAFLGEMEPESVAALRQALDTLAGSGAAPLALGSPWWLPRRRPRLLSVAIDDDEGVLRETQAILVAALRRRAQFEPEQRIFFPHVTVARVRRGFKVRPSPTNGPSGIEFEGTRVSLYESVDGYRELYSVALER